MRLLKAKLSTIIISAVAVATVAGAGAVLAAHGNAGNASTSASTSAGASAQHNENGFEAQGVIQQVTFDQGTTQSGSLVFLPNKQQTTVTVVFNASTKIEVEGDTSTTSQGQGDDDGAHQGTLQAGMNAEVKGTLQTDGSVLASNIEAHTKAANDNDDTNNNDQEDQQMVGVIQSVDQNAHTFVLLPDGQTTPVTIAFDAKTNIEDGHDGGQNAALAAGAHVRVEVVKQADGSLYAKEIKPADNQGDGDQNGGNNGGDGDGHNGQPTPTPGSGGDGSSGGSGSGN
jgi:hypothetical protein